MSIIPLITSIKVAVVKQKNVGSTVNLRRFTIEVHWWDKYTYYVVHTCVLLAQVVQLSQRPIIWNDAGSNIIRTYLHYYK